MRGLLAGVLGRSRIRRRCRACIIAGYAAIIGCMTRISRGASVARATGYRRYRAGSCKCDKGDQGDEAHEDSVVLVVARLPR